MGKEIAVLEMQYVKGSMRNDPTKFLIYLVFHNKVPNQHIIIAEKSRDCSRTI
jgi:hypothetical protein